MSKKIEINILTAVCAVTMNSVQYAIVEPGIDYAIDMDDNDAGSTVMGIELGNLMLKNQIFEENVGIISDDCAAREAKLTSTAFIGQTGVGKSTISSFLSIVPGLFDVETSNSGSTTRGTWLSSQVVEDYYAEFADDVFVPVEEMLHLSNLSSLASFTNKSNLAFIDTEGLVYQTAYGPNYDTITILPHLLISENVILVVRDRLAPIEVEKLIAKIVDAALMTDGSFIWREDKVFGHLQ